jgi:formylglycine-generating enzyme required for sulfatase activity
VSCFLLDQYEVTVGRYRQFVNAVSPPGYGPGWTPALGSGKHSHLNGGRGLVDVAPHAGTGVTYETGWSEADAESFPGFTGGGLGLAGCGPYSTGTASPGADENLPIDCVDWIDAYAFCIWDGGFLPSEAEWEYAAAGGSQQREYPWGEADPGRSNRYAIYECNYGGPCTGSPDSIAPVGWATLGAARWGQLDLAGNVWEWTLDDYAAYVDPCVDCAYLPQSAGYPVIRGGRFDDLPPVLEPSYRTYPTSNGPGIGFRCARAP